MPSALKNRIRRLQNQRTPEMLATVYYDCIVDGKHQEMTILDIAYAESFEGKEVTKGPQCRVEYTPAATPEEVQANLRELDRIMQEEIEKYNSPEEVAKRAAEYEQIRQDRIRRYGVE